MIRCKWAEWRKPLNQFQVIFYFLCFVWCYRTSPSFHGNFARCRSTNHLYVWDLPPFEWTFPKLPALPSFTAAVSFFSHRSQFPLPFLFPFPPAFTVPFLFSLIFNLLSFSLFPSIKIALSLSQKEVWNQINIKKTIGPWNISHLIRSCSNFRILWRTFMSEK